MSKPDSNRVRVDGGDRTRTGNDRGVRARYALKSRESSVAPADCHIDPQVMEVDIFDLSAVRREAGALSARMFAVVDDVSLAVAIERPSRDGVPWQQLGPYDDVLSTPIANSVNFHRIAERLNTNLGKVIESSRVMQEASKRLIHGIERLRDGVGDIKDTAGKFKLD